jgi:hypothetical protein
MKKLSIYLFLIFFGFSAPSFADDIQDFEIVGMSIGDSLLDYMSEKEIKENVGFVYEDKKFTVSVYNKSSEMYDLIGIEYKSKDKKYKIHGVQGMIDFPNNIEGCYKKQDEIEKEISSMFTESKKKDWGILKLDFGGEGSTYKPITFDFKNDHRMSVDCYYLTDTPQKNNLKVTMTSNELRKYLKLTAEPANN